MLHGVTMSHPLVALQEIARRTSREELVIAVDPVLADRYGTVTRLGLTEVRAYAAEATGRGATALRAAVDLARERAWSAQETRTRLMLETRGWPQPVLNHEVIDPATRIAYYVDLAYPQQRIAIEYDGAEHLTDADRVKRDHRKSAALHAEGWTVIRVYAEDLRDPSDLLARLDHAVAEAAGRPVLPAATAPATATAPTHLAGFTVPGTGTVLLDGSRASAPGERAPR